MLITLAGVDDDKFVRHLGLFKEKGNLEGVGRREVEQRDHAGVLLALSRAILVYK